MEQRKASLDSQLGTARCEAEDTEELFWLRESDDYQSKAALGNALSAQYRFREAAESYLSAARAAGRFDRALAAAHGGKPDDREWHGCRDGGGAARAQPDQHDTGYLHARV